MGAYQGRADSPEVRARIDAALKLVPAIVEQMRAVLFERARRDDLTSYGNEGALSAGRTYDHRCGVPFNHWGALKIRGAIIDRVRADSALSRRLRERLRAVEVATWAREGIDLDEGESIPTSATAADVCITSRLAAMATAYAAGALLARGEGVLESIQDERGTPEDALARRELGAAVRNAIAERPTAERVQLERYYFDGATMARTSRRLTLALAGFVLGALLLGCGSHPKGDPEPDQPNQSIEECEAFLASYEHCLASLGPADIARARAEQTRAALAARAAPGSRAALRQKCTDNLVRLKTTCR